MLSKKGEVSLAILPIDHLTGIMPTTTLAAPAITTLTPYSGAWGFQQAAHLLRRASFAPLKSEIDEAVALGLQGSLDQLFAAFPLPPEPVFYDYTDHPDAGIGESWVDLHLNPDDANQDANARRRAYESWLTQTTANGGFTIREKMVFFWLNHFGIGNQGDYRGLYRYMTRLRENGTGDFRQLVKDMTVDPMMLRFLNGETSTASSPNENFAREILELYTIGKGPQVSPGDYTNYTEQDVTELARAFTGWRVRYNNTREPGLTVESYYQANRHDTTDKQLSHRFDDVVITNGDDNEYNNVVDIIFQKPAVANYICKKLYRQFVYYKITPDIETNVIEPMAQLLVDSDYVIAPALRALLNSEHFYEMRIAGDVIKTPLEFVHSILRPTGFYDQGDVVENYQAARLAHRHADSTGMHLNEVPSVAGWTAYYQEPSFFRLWLNTTTIQLRTGFLRNSTVRWHSWSGSRHYVDWLAMLGEFDNAFDPNFMIEEMAQRLMPQPLNQAQLDGIKELLLPGLEDFVWSGEYADFIANPMDDALRESVNDRLTNMLYGMLQLAEFQVH